MRSCSTISRIVHGVFTEGPRDSLGWSTNGRIVFLSTFAKLAEPNEPTNWTVTEASACENPRAFAGSSLSEGGTWKIGV